ISRDPLLKRIAPLILRCYAVLASVSRCYSTLEGRLVTCYSPGRHFTHGLLHFLVRLACVRHAASVDSEPGSNSRLKPDVCRRVVGRLPSPGSKAGMAPPLSFSLSGSKSKKLEDRGGLTCEIARTYARTYFSKTESRSAEAARIQSRRKRTNANPTVLET